MIVDKVQDLSFPEAVRMGAMIDDDLVDDLLDLRPPVEQRTWPSVLAENN